MKMFTYRIYWSQQVRETIAQDESRYLGTQQVYVDFNVVAESRQIAEQEAVKYCAGRKDANIESCKELDVHTVVMTHRRSYFTAEGGLSSPEVVVVGGLVQA